MTSNCVSSVLKLVVAVTGRGFVLNILAALSGEGCGVIGVAMAHPHKTKKQLLLS